METLTITNFLW